VYEYYGSYWHGDPRVYPPERTSANHNRTFGELHRKTLEREAQILALGYKLVTMWELDDKD